MKNIIFIAAPAAGKGTISNMICSKYNIPHISTGDLLRDERGNGKKKVFFLWTYKQIYKKKDKL